jgi:hypothetical protein
MKWGENTKILFRKGFFWGDKEAIRKLEELGLIKKLDRRTANYLRHACHKSGECWTCDLREQGLWFCVLKLFGFYRTRNAK